MAKAAGTAQLGILGGSHTPEVDDAAKAEGSNKIRKNKQKIKAAEGRIALGAIFISHPFDWVHMKTTRD